MARIDLQSNTKPARKSIDANWTKKQKTAAAVVAGVLAFGAVGAGIWYAVDSLPPALPTSATEALAVMKSAKFDQLDEERKQQYAEEAARLLRELPEEERRELRKDDTNRAAIDKIREEQMDEMIKKLARGETPDMPFGPFGGGERRQGGQGGQGGGNGQPREGGPGGAGDRWRNMSEADRAKAIEERKVRMDQRMAQQFNSGNAQKTGLRGEFFKTMRQNGGPGGPGGGRGPGGGGGGGGGGEKKPGGG